MLTRCCEGYMKHSRCALSFLFLRGEQAHVIVRVGTPPLSLDYLVERHLLLISNSKYSGFVCQIFILK